MTRKRRKPQIIEMKFCRDGFPIICTSVDGITWVEQPYRGNTLQPDATMNKRRNEMLDVRNARRESWLQTIIGSLVLIALAGFVAFIFIILPELMR